MNQLQLLMEKKIIQIKKKKYYIKIKGNEYTFLASQREEHLGGEDFNQR